jgi:hypothetical protein
MGLIHEPNSIQWKPGDLVIHDSDAKRADMLMIVLGQDSTGVFRTRYAFPWAQPRPWRRKIWRNTVAWLHDPARFGINIPRLLQSSSNHLQDGSHHHHPQSKATPSPGGEAVTVVHPDGLAKPGN